ncbi:MAG TPA: hypothetical protein VFV89_23950 [Nocardioides sp.]|nr:hypothetical protein [Nocardioides sp.]
MQSSSFVLLYASLARAPQYAMTLASRMAATAFEARDLDGVQRWTNCYAELRPIFGDLKDDLPVARVS